LLLVVKFKKKICHIGFILQLISLLILAIFLSTKSLGSDNFYLWNEQMPDVN